MFQFFFRLSLHLHCLRSNENQIVDVRSSWVKINRSKCLFPEFLLDLFVSPLHVTLSTQSTLESKRRSHKESHIVFFSKLKSSTLLISPTSTLTAITKLLKPGLKLTCLKEVQWVKASHALNKVLFSMECQFSYFKLKFIQEMIKMHSSLN